MPEPKLVKDGYPDPEPGDYGSFVRSWVRSLRARNLSPKTIKTYREAGEGFGAYLARTKGTADLAAIQREHVEGFIVHLLDTAADSTANNRYRGLQQFFKWALEEGEIRDDPMARMKPPVITEKAVPILSDGTLKKLLRACAGREFTELRDTAIIRVLIDTGMRREEVASIMLGDLDLDTDSVTVTRKGRPAGHAGPVGQDVPGAGALPALAVAPAAGPPSRAVARREAPRPADRRRC